MDRRDFLKKTALGVAAVAATSILEHPAIAKANELINPKTNINMKKIMIIDGGPRKNMNTSAMVAAFAEVGDQPVGFALQGSPFGKEPFDGIYEMKYQAGAGTYQDNFDGPLFLHPLADEPTNEPLWAVFSDQFISEMQRRSAYMGWDKYKDVWFGYNVSELTKEKIRQALSE